MSIPSEICLRPYFKWIHDSIVHDEKLEECSGFLRNTYHKEILKAGGQYTREYLQDNFVEMQGWVGKTATFTYFERTKANSYRHPLFKAIRDYE